MSRPPRIVIAGQVPPPIGGQNVMIQCILDQLRSIPNVQAEHLEFCFTKNFKSARRASLGKVIEMLLVLRRLFQLRLRGPIDLLVYPPGGPQNVPLLRDLALLPWILLLSKKVMLHFHAGGIGDRLAENGWLPRMVAYLYSKCDSAIVMTRYNQRDPKCCGIQNIYIYPHYIKDSYDASMVRREGGRVRILYMGHLCPEKGTPTLLKAFAAIADTYPDVDMELAGEPLPPYNEDALMTEIGRLGIANRVRLLGVVSGDEKACAFGCANIFVFPSVAHESFGIVTVEAMMWGLPIIASNWRGNSDVLGGSSGGRLFHPPHSSEALAKAIEDLLKDRSSWVQAGACNREVYLENYGGEIARTAVCELIIQKAMDVPSDEYCCN